MTVVSFIIALTTTVIHCHSYNEGIIAIVLPAESIIFIVLTTEVSSSRLKRML